MSERSELLELVIEETDDKMRKAVEHARAEFAGVRTGRASSTLIERLTVEAYDSTLPLQQLASFKVPEARMLLVIPFDKGTMPAIEKSIRNSDLGLNPSNDGTVIRLVFPQLTEERRKDLVKRVRHQAEEGKVSLRNLRRGARHEFDALVKDGEATEDEVSRAEKELDKLTHSHEAQIDQALDHKEHELLEV